MLPPRSFRPQFDREKLVDFWVGEHRRDQGKVSENELPIRRTICKIHRRAPSATTALHADFGEYAANWHPRRQPHVVDARNGANFVFTTHLKDITQFYVMCMYCPMKLCL